MVLIPQIQVVVFSRLPVKRNVIYDIYFITYGASASGKNVVVLSLSMGLIMVFGQSFLKVDFVVVENSIL